MRLPNSVKARIARPTGHQNTNASTISTIQAGCQSQMPGR
jgi:hypothetical protein